MHSYNYTKREEDDEFKYVTQPGGERLRYLTIQEPILHSLSACRAFTDDLGKNLLPFICLHAIVRVQTKAKGSCFRDKCGRGFIAKPMLWFGVLRYEVVVYSLQFAFFEIAAYRGILQLLEEIGEGGIFRCRR